MVVASLIIGSAGGESDFSEAGTAYPIAAGLSAIAAINRNPLIGLAATGIAAWASGVLIIAPAKIAAWTYAGEAAILLAAGLATLARAHGASAPSRRRADRHAR